MKKLFQSILMLIMACFLSVPAFADVHVNGYYKQDGTYVQPHYRSSPNSTPNDNWSTQGNTNPYTGQKAIKNQIIITKAINAWLM